MLTNLWETSCKSRHTNWLQRVGKLRISLWCDGKRPSDDDSSDDEQERCKRRKKSQKQSKLEDREDELERIFKQLKEKHRD